MTKTQELEVVAWDKLRELIGQYFDLGYAEGVVQRDVDTMSGDAQRTLSEIEGIISVASATIEGLEAKIERLMKDQEDALSASVPSNFGAQIGWKRWKARAEAAEAERDALRKALEPFVTHLNEMKFDLDHKGEELPGDQTCGWIYITLADFRAARQALEASK